MVKISIIGCGFVGLCLAVVAATRGIKTIAVDNDFEKIKKIKSGIIPFYEPKLKDLLDEALNNKLDVTTDIAYAIKNSDITFVTVGTPANFDGSANLDFIRTSVKDIALTLRDKNEFHLVVIKSTVLPTTTNDIIKPLLENNSMKKIGENIGLVMNPEFLREGSAITDTENPHLIVIGSNDERSSEILELFYRELYGNVIEIITTSLESAELIKYANNSFLATKISFINSIANICQKVPNTDINVIANAIGKDPRIGSLFLKAGPGYGGSCFPKDVNALIDFSKKLGYEPILINATNEVNNQQAVKVFELIRNTLGEINGMNISILGLAFKKDTDDIRESVSLKLIRYLLEDKATILAHDPMAIENSRKVYGDRIKLFNKVEDCLFNSDCCVVMTDWDEYKELVQSSFKNMRRAVIIDARRILDKEKFDHEVKFIALGAN